MSLSDSEVLDALVEELAAIEHMRWAHWQAYVHEKGTRTPDGGLFLPPELISRWDHQIATPYHALSEAEKESDRDQVRRYLGVIRQALISKR